MAPISLAFKQQLDKLNMSVNDVLSDISDKMPKVDSDFLSDISDKIPKVESGFLSDISDKMPKVGSDFLSDISDKMPKVDSDFLSDISDKIPKFDPDFLDKAFKTPFTEISNFFKNTGGLFFQGLGDVVEWITKYFDVIICIVVVLVALVVFIKFCACLQMCASLCPSTKKKRCQPFPKTNVHKTKAMDPLVNTTLTQI